MQRLMTPPPPRLGLRPPTAEVSTVNRKAALYELATVAAVLRVAPPPDGAASGRGSPATAEEDGSSSKAEE